MSDSHLRLPQQLGPHALDEAGGGGTDMLVTVLARSKAVQGARQRRHRTGLLAHQRLWCKGMGALAGWVQCMVRADRLHQGWRCTLCSAGSVCNLTRATALPPCNAQGQALQPR